MEARRFRGATMAEAYARVREALGESAVIHGTYSETVPGSGARVFEVVASAPDGDTPPFAGLANDAAAHDLVRAVAESRAAAPSVSAPDALEARADRELAPPFVNSLAGAWLRENEGVPVTPPPAALAAANPAPEAVPAPAAQALLASMDARMRAIEDAVQRLVAGRVDAQVESGPEALRALRRRLLDQGMTPHVLSRFLERVARTVVHDATSQQVLQVAERTLAAQLPPPVRIDVGRGGRALFIVGPAGAGKTTLALRLARDLTARGTRAVIAGTDVGRAGAPQQLLACAAAAGVEVRLCYTPGELKTLLGEGVADLVIVDTAGHDGARRERMAEMNSFMQAAPARSSVLALPASTNTADLLRLTTAFAPFGLAGLAVTRTDESTLFGGVASAAIESGLGIALVTHGDGIAEGLASGDNHALALAVLTGRWPEAAPGRPVRGLGTKEETGAGVRAR